MTDANTNTKPNRDHSTDVHLNSQDNINPLLIPLLAAMEAGLNQLFAMDPETFAKLSRFRGQIIAFHITDIDQRLYFFPDDQGVQIICYYEGEPDTIISGSLPAFAKMAVAEENEKTRSVFKGDIQISGDMALGQHFQALFQQLDIDWEEHLSRITGDVIAHSLGNVARGLLGFGKKVSTSLGMDVSEYLQYETRDIASGPEIEHFNQQVDSIRNDVDRAEARLLRLEKMLSVNTGQTSDTTETAGKKKPVSQKTPVSQKKTIAGKKSSVKKSTATKTVTQTKRNNSRKKSTKK